MDINQYVIIIAVILFGLILTIYLRSHKKQVQISYFIAGITLILCSLLVTLVSAFYPNTAEGVILSQFTMVFFSLGLIYVYLHYQTLNSSHPNYPILIIQWVIFISIFVSWCVLPYQYYIMNIPISLDDVYVTSLWTMSPSTTLFALFFNLFLGLLQFILSISLSLQILSKMYRKTKNSSVNTERIAMIVLLFYRVIFILNLIFPYSENRTAIVSTISPIALILSIIGLSMLMFNYIVHPDYLYLLPFPIHSIMIYNNSGLLIYERKADIEILKQDVSMLMTGSLTAIQMMIHEVLGNGSQLKFIDVGHYKILFASLPFDKAIFAIITQQDTKLFENSIQRFTKNFPEKILDQINQSGDVGSMQETIDILIKSNFPYIQFK